MRQIILDTETTGLEVKQNHRIIEIGCIELQNRRRTQHTFHQYLNPEREIDDGAFEVHGLSLEFLRDKPCFRDIVAEFIDFIRDAELIIHNAPFDVGFIDNELRLLGDTWGNLGDYCKIVDTLTMAREKHPGQKNNLDALCLRYAVDNSQREQHGALLDAHILADVYLAMTGGQTALSLDHNAELTANVQASKLDPQRARLKVESVSQEELSAHLSRLREIDDKSDGQCVWRSLDLPFSED